MYGLTSGLAARNGMAHYLIPVHFEAVVQRIALFASSFFSDKSKAQFRTAGIGLLPIGTSQPSRMEDKHSFDSVSKTFVY
jgi:hypothetical protein